MILLLAIMFLISLGSAFLITHFGKKITRKSSKNSLYWLWNILIFISSFFGFVILLTYIVFGRVDGLFDKSSLNFALIFVLFPLSFWIMKMCEQFPQESKNLWFWNFCTFIGALTILLLIIFFVPSFF